MSRFARLQNGPVRTWSPPESPFRIEYSPALLREVRIAGGGVDAFGVLYGIRNGGTIRLVGARGRAGLEPIGVFASRARGAVFLTEQDLERFEKAEALVAMVIAGETGGFFVRDPAGSLETVCSYEEFSIHEPTIPAPPAKKARWPWALGLPLLALLFYRPHHEQLALSMRETDGQLRITWNIPTTQTLTILDGGVRTYAPVVAGQTSATYARHSNDVTIGIGAAQVRFVGQPLPPSEMERESANIEELKRKVSALRAASALGQRKIAALQRRLQ
jgi:hypothetical protein